MFDCELRERCLQDASEIRDVPKEKKKRENFFFRAVDVIDFIELLYDMLSKMERTRNAHPVTTNLFFIDVNENIRDVLKSGK